MKGQFYNHADTAWRMKNNAAVTVAEVANLIAEDDKTRLAWMVKNNPSSVNDTLRHKCGFENLPFKPNEKQLLGLIDMLYGNGDARTLQCVQDNFVFDGAATNGTAAPELVEYLKLERVIQ